MIKDKAYYQRKAQEVVAFLSHRGAERTDPDVTPNAFSVRDLADRLDFKATDWTRIKEAALEAGVPLVGIPGLGHIRGSRQEVYKNLSHSAAMVNGWTRRGHRYMRAMLRGGFTIEEMQAAADTAGLDPNVFYAMFMPNLPRSDDDE